MIRMMLAASAAMMVAGVASAQTVDGVRDASYGTAKSHVTYLPGTPEGNFGAPTPFSDTASYDIYLTSDASNVYGFIQADRQTGLPFANLYWDLDPANGNGSDLGFEVGNQRAFVPGVPGYSAQPLAGIAYAISGDGTGFEFSLANSLFTSPIAGLSAYPTASIGDSIVLRLSQSFGYSVAGGATYGDDRLGRVTLGGGAAAVPEPASWAMMIGGFGLVGGAMRRRAKARVTFA